MTGIPAWSVGQVLTADDVNNWLAPSGAVKPTDQTLTGTNALTNDSKLFLPIVAGAAYEYTVLLNVTGSQSNGASDIKVAMEWPGGGNGYWWSTGFLTAGGALTASAVHVETASGTPHGFHVDGAGPSPVLITGYVETGPADSVLRLVWAPVTNNSETVTVNSKSKITMQRIG